jgi:hypothetical protein|tara:strand:+ start:1418 stop:1723 length:306 start_codon:yes stop_codon:yes gene_type:complete
LLEFFWLLSNVEPPKNEALTRQGREAPHDYGAVFALNNLLFAITEGRFPGAPIKKIQLMLDGLAENFNFKASAADIVFYQALLLVSEENLFVAANLATSSF